MKENVLKTKICVVDDEESIRETYKVRLEEAGYEVMTASNGEEGMRIIKEQKPDLALVDINMPKKNGVELIHDMQNDPELAKIPVIVLTNFDDMETIEKVQKYNTRFYIVKALNTPQKVVGMIKEALNSH